MQQVTIPAHIQAQLINSIGRIEAPEASFIIGCCSTTQQYQSPFSANTKELPGTASLLLLTIIDADLRTCIEAQSRIENACSPIMELASRVIPLQAAVRCLPAGKDRLSRNQAKEGIMIIVQYTNRGQKLLKITFAMQCASTLQPFHSSQIKKVSRFSEYFKLFNSAGFTSGRRIN